MFKRIALIACSCALTASPLFAATPSANDDQTAQPATSGTHSKPSFFHRIWPFDRHKSKVKKTEKPKTENPKAPKNSGTELIKVVPTADVKRSESLMKSVRASEVRQKKNEPHPAVANRETRKTPTTKRDTRRGAEETAPIAKTDTENSQVEALPKTANHEKKAEKHSNGFSAPISFVPDSTASAEAPKADASFGTKLVEDETKARSQYEALKAKALADEKIQKLKEKADGALTDEEGRVATKAYYRALFSKIHQINHQSSLDAYIDRMHAALTKRLDHQKM